ncbi:MAG: response regulator transcription factor [Chthoniobacteraceae bacterium]|nr:response regulator transcription factor [Chthoniobacteraceae bacterium]
MMLQKILVAEDEPDMLELVASNVSRAGYDVIKAQDGPSALAAMGQLPSLVVLDLMLPGMSGLEICRTLKANVRTAAVPIIMLTAKAEEVDRIVGLELGADDYITKPFSPRELVLRIKSILRRTVGTVAELNCLAVGDIAMDIDRLEVWVREQLVRCTATEFRLLRVLLERRGVVQSRATLLNDVWGYENAIDTRTVDTHIRRLREKLGPAGDCIKTVRSFGYRIAK